MWEMLQMVLTCNNENGIKCVQLIKWTKWIFTLLLQWQLKYKSRSSKYFRVTYELKKEETIPYCEKIGQN